MRLQILILFSLLGVNFSWAQQNPVSWDHHFEKVNENTYKLVFTASIDAGWYLYSQYLESDEGPIPTSFNFTESGQFKLAGKTEEVGKKKEGYDELFGMNIVKYGNKVEFVQKVKVTGKETKVAGFVEFMTCDDNQCLPPNQLDFVFVLK